MHPTRSSWNRRTGLRIAMLAFSLAATGVTALVVAQGEPPREAILDGALGGWGAPVDLDEIGAGELLWKTERGLIPLPSLAVDVELTVTGVLLAGRVTQSFHNPTTETIEAIYAFPLSGSAAVHHMEMRIGDRTIRSVIRERSRARRAYEQAKATGRKAALLDRHRPNLFTTSAANINPGERISVVLEFLDEVDYEDGSFELAFPLAYLPRYAPDGLLDGTDPHERQAVLGGHAASGAVFPQARIEVRLRPGVALDDVDSASHTIFRRDEADAVVVRTADEGVPARRDFLLRWTPRRGDQPRTAVLVEDRADGRYALLMLYPPIPGSEAGLGLPTETLFVIDVSGSMAGPSLEQARFALRAALDRLRPDDRFNILKFSATSEPFRAAFEYAEPHALEAARVWVRGLHAGGGTEIHAALARALRMMGASRSSHAQRIVFLTDGAVADESRLYRTIVSDLGETRLHAIGIGSAPNAHLMRKMARFGRGLCRFVADADAAENQIDAFFAQLDRPVMTDLDLEWDGLEIEDAYPAVLPDLHAETPLVLYGRVADGSRGGQVRLGGHTRAGWIETSAQLTASAEPAVGIGARWARAKVEALMDSLHEGADPDDVRADVIETALAFDLVTRYTSLVAVEQAATALGEARPFRLAAALPQGGTHGPWRLSLGLALLASGAVLLAWLKR